jgi:hypothetical protein
MKNLTEHDTDLIEVPRSRTPDTVRLIAVILAMAVWGVAVRLLAVR